MFFNRHLEILSLEETRNLIKKEHPALIEDVEKFSINMGKDLVSLYTFTAEELLDIFPLDFNKNNLMQILNRISFSFGDLKNENTEHFFLSNPIWKKPFIKLEKNKFFIPNPVLLQVNALDILENLISNDVLKRAYHKARGDFLEDHLYEICSEKFNNCQIFRNSKYKIKEKEFENDLCQFTS